MYYLKFVFILILTENLNPSTGIPMSQGSRNSLNDEIENDLQRQEVLQRLASIGSQLTERINDFETKYVEKIGALQTKIDIYINEKDKNNAMEVVAEMMKVIMKIQDENIELKESFVILKNTIGQVRTDTIQEMSQLKENFSSWILLQKQEINEKILELTDAFVNVNHTRHTVDLPIGYNELYTTTTPTTSSSCVNQRDSRDTEFILMFIPNYNHKDENIELIFTSYSGQSSVMLTSTVSGVSRNVTLSNHAVHVNVSRDIVHVNSSVIQNKGLYIKSTEPISVHGYSNCHSCCTSSAFTALPVDMLGTDYIAISYHPHFDSQIGVVAVEDSSIITVTINTTQSGSVSFNGHTYVNGDTISLTLNRLNTIRIASRADLTGTKIHSDKPVGVISGNRCAMFIAGYCDNVVSMLPPTNKWGLNFIIPRINPANTMIIRIVPSVDMTTIEVHNNTVQNTYTSNKTVEITLSSEQLTFVYCNHPCLVVQFSAGLNNFMAIVPSTNQFLNRYVVDTPTVKQFISYASVIVKTSDVSGLRYNGQPISSASISASDKYNVDWTIITFAIKNAINHIEHISSHVNFGLTQYGFGLGLYEGYGFPVAYSYGCSIN